MLASHSLGPTKLTPPSCKITGDEGGIINGNKCIQGPCTPSKNQTTFQQVSGAKSGKAWCLFQTTLTACEEHIGIFTVALQTAVDCGVNMIHSIKTVTALSYCVAILQRND